MKPPYPLPSNKPYTGNHIREFFRAKGISMADWALANGYAPHEVYALISGQTKGTRGKSHEIAVRLGLKLPVEKISA